MSISVWRFSALLLIAALCPQCLFAQENIASEAKPRATTEVAAEAAQILTRHCARCHHLQKVGNTNLDILNRQSLIDNGLIDGDSKGEAAVDASKLWDKIASNEMPKGTPRALTSIERRVIKEWLGAGAPLPEQRRNPVSITVLQELEAIELDLLRKVPERDRPDQRYFTLNNLYNDLTVSEVDLAFYRAALSKAVNSLSTANSVVPPLAINPEKTIFRIDLKNYGWDERHIWQKILQLYPYGLEYRLDPLRDINTRISQFITGKSQQSVILLRGDWFVATATRPPLYHDILDIPKHVSILEHNLKVERFEDEQVYENDSTQRRSSFFQPKAKLWRAGFAASGVSSHNRMVERRIAKGLGGYWKSYDFKSSGGQGNLFQFPLGPEFKANLFSADVSHRSFAFKHDGGEIIYPLNNGLQGYMLIDNLGNRIDEGPISIVRDSLEISGTPAVVNGISCMNCHARGMIHFADEIRKGHGLFSAARDLVLDQYPTPEEMEKLVGEDESRFLRAQNSAVSEFLPKAAPDEITEPIGLLATRYYADLNLDRAAAELNIGPNQLQAAIANNPELIRMGLKPLTNKDLIKREVWESRDFFATPGQRVLQVLDIANPIVSLAP